MTKTEDQLRDALHGIADLVGTGARQPVETEPRRRAAWLVPLAVGMAVILVLVSGVFVADSLRSDGSETAAPPAGPGRHFVAIAIKNGKGHPTEAAVRDAATGKVTATVPRPAGIDSWSSASGPGGSVFHLVGTELAGSKVVRDRLFRVRLSAKGRVAELTEVAIGGSKLMLNGLAVAPDGKRAAFSAGADRNDWAGPPDMDKIKIVDLADGRVEATVKLPMFADIRNLSWSADGRWLAFKGEHGGKAGRMSSPPARGKQHPRLSSKTPDEIWMVDTRTRRARQVPLDGALGWLTAPVLRVDARSVYVIDAPVATARPSSRIIEVDVATGRLRRVLFKQPSGTEEQLWALARDAAGRRLLTYLDGYGYRIDIATGESARFRLPGPGPHTLAW